MKYSFIFNPQVRIDQQLKVRAFSIINLVLFGLVNVYNHFFADSSLSAALTLETNKGGRIWNVSAMPGWLATKYLLSLVSIREIHKYENSTCQAVITKVIKFGISHTLRVHVSCRSKVEGSSGQFFCQKCGITHLNEMLNKPGQMVRSIEYILYLWLLTMNLDETGTLSTKNCLLSQQAVSTLKIRSKQETFDETIEATCMLFMKFCYLIILSFLVEIPFNSLDVAV